MRGQSKISDTSRTRSEGWSSDTVGLAISKNNCYLRHLMPEHKEPEKHALVALLGTVEIAHGKQWAGLIVRGVHRLGHAHALIAPKWLHTMNLAIEGAEKLSLQQAKHWQNDHNTETHESWFTPKVGWENETVLRYMKNTECPRKIAKWLILAPPGWDFCDSFSNRSWNVWVVNQPRIMPV